MKRLAFISLVAFVVGLAPSANATYIGVHWRRTVNPFTVTVVESLQARFVDNVARAAGLWSKSDKLDMVTTPGNNSATARRHCAFIKGKVHICSSNYGSTGWVGLTQFQARNHHIIAATVRLNTPLIPRTFDNIVTCHELGHTIGLAHRSQSTSCMKQGQTAAHPDSADYASLDKIYHHLDGRTPESGTLSYFSTQ